MRYQGKIGLMVGMLSVSLTAAASEFNVNCGTGQSVANAVSRAKANDTVVVSGKCADPIVITQDGLKVIGNQAMFNIAADKDAVTIAGAQRVAISGIGIAGGKVGILGQSGSTFSLQDVSVESSAASGVLIQDSSHVDLRNVRILSAGLDGIKLTTGSGASISDSLDIESASGFGIAAEGLSNVLTNNAVMKVSNSGAMGVHIVTGSNLFINDSDLDASGNTLRGVSVNSGGGFFAFNSKVSANGTLALDGMAFANAVVDMDRAATLTANGNGRHGIVIESTTFTSFVFAAGGGPVIEANNNRRNGIRVVLGGKLEVKAGSKLTATGNGGSGLFVDDGSGANLRNSTITGNGSPADISVTFGSRLDALNNASNALGSLVCDSTAASRGILTCP